MLRIALLRLLLLHQVLAAIEPPQDRLHRYLMLSYDADTRPVFSANATLGVTFSVQFSRLMDLDEKNQILHLNAIVMESWIDERLAWRPAEFANIRDTILPASSVWLPDIYVYNNAADGNEGFVHDNNSRVSLHHTGRVLWSIPTTIRSSCSVDVLYFPFDHQFCEVLFASWTYDASQLDLSLPSGESGVDTSQLQEHQELKLSGIRMSPSRREMLNNLTYPVLSMKMHIQRKALYYSYTVIAPSIMLCVLTMFSFWLPCHIAEKVEIGLNVFLFLYFLELLIAENTPESNSTPLIGIFLNMVMTLNSLSLILATLVIHVHGRSEHDPCPRVPAWLWLIGSRLLGPLTFSCQHLRTASTEEDQALKQRRRPQRRRQGQAEGATKATPMPLLAEVQAAEAAKKAAASKTQMETDYDADDTESDEGDETDGSEFGWVPQRRLERTRREQQKWTYLAEVIDKFLFEFYLVCTVLSVLIVLHILPQANSRAIQFDKF